MTTETTVEKKPKVSDEGKDAINGTMANILRRVESLSNKAGKMLGMGKEEDRNQFHELLDNTELVQLILPPKIIAAIDFVKIGIGTDFDGLIKDGVKGKAGVKMLDDAMKGSTKQIGIIVANKLGIKDTQAANLVGGVAGTIIGDQVTKLLAKKFNLPLKTSTEKKAEAEAKKAEAEEAKKKKKKAKNAKRKAKKKEAAEKEQAIKDKIADLENKVSGKGGNGEEPKEETIVADGNDKTPEDKAVDEVEKIVAADGNDKTSEDDKGITVSHDGWVSTDNSSVILTDEELEANKQKLIKAGDMNELSDKLEEQAEQKDIKKLCEPCKLSSGKIEFKTTDTNHISNGETPKDKIAKIIEMYPNGVPTTSSTGTHGI